MYMLEDLRTRLKLYLEKHQYQCKILEKLIQDSNGDADTTLIYMTLDHGCHVWRNGWPIENGNNWMSGRAARTSSARLISVPVMKVGLPSSPVEFEC